MKKLLGLIAIMALGFTTAFAQTPAAVKNAPTKAVAKKEVKKVTVPIKKDAKATTTTMATTKVKTATLKKDGTPDMRLKENKVKAQVKTTHVKKDGSPDMRYKANKKANK